MESFYESNKSIIWIIIISVGLFLVLPVYMAHKKHEKDVHRWETTGPEDALDEAMYKKYKQSKEKEEIQEMRKKGYTPYRTKTGDLIFKKD